MIIISLAIINYINCKPLQYKIGINCYNEKYNSIRFIKKHLQYKLIFVIILWQATSQGRAVGSSSGP